MNDSALQITLGAMINEVTLTVMNVHMYIGNQGTVFNEYNHWHMHAGS